MKTKLCPKLLLSLAGLALALELISVAHAENEAAFVAHEWGTFTSVQGSDGELIPWNPFVPTDLPDFVYDRTKARGGSSVSNPFGLGPKFGLWALQRMETPVIYFYTPEPKQVRVAVDFPKGTITEWYPRAGRFGPTMSTTLMPVEKRSFVEWTNVRLIPARPDSALEPLLRQGTPSSHYFAARATDSSFLQIIPPPISMALSSEQREIEKFLFYRGLGDFKSPLRVEVSSGEGLILRNDSSQRLNHLFVVTMREGRGQFVELQDLLPGQSKTVMPAGSPAAASQIVEQLGDRMRRALANEGLYPREAEAMVHTWANSWFAEPGVRVLYTIPHEFIDGLLPLEIEPRPEKLERVFVGRADVITPAMESELLQSIVRFGEKDPTARAEAVAGVEKLGLGRFTGAAITRVLGPHPSEAFRKQAMDLYAASNRNVLAGLAQK